MALILLNICLETLRKLVDSFEWILNEIIALKRIHQKRVQINIPGFNLRTRNSYFLILIEVFTNHVLIENIYFTNCIEWTEYKIMVLKSENKYQIIWQCHNFKTFLMTISTIINFFIKQKFCKHLFLCSWKTSWKDERIKLFDLL